MIVLRAHRMLFFVELRRFRLHSARPPVMTVQRFLYAKERNGMDQTILEILQLDAEIDAKLTAADAERKKQLSDARRQASAVKEASRHQVRDTIVEYEEQAKEECEQKLAKLRAGFDKQGDAVEEQFVARHDDLLDSLFRETLKEAEA